MLTEHIIHIPLFTNDRKGLTSYHLRFKQTLCALFGGYTVTQCEGGWVDPNSSTLYEEEMLRFVTAFDDNDEKLEQAFLDLANEAKRECEQEAIYIVLNGEVRFI